MQEINEQMTTAARLQASAISNWNSHSDIPSKSELKAELDTRIAVVQSLVRQADQRIARLESLERSWNVRAEITDGKEDLIAALIREGHTASEIATKTGLPLGDVEMTISTFSQT